MKLCFSTLSCPGWTFDRVVSAARESGFQGIEVRGICGEMQSDKIPEFSPSQAEKTRALLADASVSIAVLGTSVSFHDPKKTQDALEEGRRAIDICRRMGIPYIRVFGDHIPCPEDESRTIRAVSDGIRRLIDYAGESGVSVLLEVHGDFNRAERILEVAQQVASDRFGIIWDIEHSDKVYGDDFRAFYDRVKSLVRHIHVKDYLRDENVTLVPVGQGKVPVPAIVHTLLSDGYDGYFSLEWEKAWQPKLAEPEEVIPAYAAYMKTL